MCQHLFACCSHWQVEALTQKAAEMSYTREAVKELVYSPDGSKLAAGSHDNSIDIFDATRGWGLCCAVLCCAALFIVGARCC